MTKQKIQELIGDIQTNLEDISTDVETGEIEASELKQLEAYSTKLRMITEDRCFPQ